MFMILAGIGIILVSLSHMMRNRRIGESLNNWGEWWPSKDSLTPTEYWLHRAGFFIIGAGGVLTVIALCALPFIFRR